MSPQVALGLAVAAGLVCPAHMWWSQRRGRRTACCPPSLNPESDRELEALRARQERLRERVAENELAVVPAAGRRPTASRT